MLLFLVFTAVIASLIYYVFKCSNYWEKFDIPQVKGLPFVGNFGNFVLKKAHITEIYSQIYNLHPNKRYTGMYQFTSPALLIRDLDLLKQITVKDFDHFVDHQSVVKSKSDRYINKMLISLNGNDWREMRSTLSPVFTGSKMRNMFLLISECAENFAKYFEKQNGVIEIPLKEIFTKFTTDVVATSAFGLKCDSLEDPENEFLTTAKDLIKFSALRNIKLVLLSLFPALCDLFRIQLFSTKSNNFFERIVHDTMEHREKHHIIRPDLIHLLMQAKQGNLKQETITQETGFATVEESEMYKKTEKKELTDDEITAQAMLFFFAGFDTTSTATSFLTYELAINPEVQRKLQEEIDRVLEKSKDGKLAYEDVMTMKYLDQVVSEGLRKWTPTFLTDRLCVKDYKIEATTPEEKTLYLEKGVQIIIPVRAIHHNPEYYPNPDKFDPERFSEENKHKLVAGAYLPFGVGPRNCIGSRFALMVIKCLCVHLLAKFDLVPVEKTQIPFVFSPKNQMNIVPEDMVLGLKPRKVTSL